MQLPPCGMYLLTFDEFHWVDATDSREFIDCNFSWGLHQNAGGQPCWERTMIDRHADATKCVLFGLDPLCVYIRSYFFITGVYLSTL